MPIFRSTQAIPFVLPWIHGDHESRLAVLLTGRMNPGKMFDLALPLREVADGYRAMDERRAIKTLLRAEGD